DELATLEDDGNSDNNSITDFSDAETNFNVLMNDLEDDDNNNNNNTNSDERENREDNDKENISPLQEINHDEQENYSNEKSSKAERIQAIINEPKKNRRKKIQLLTKYARTRYGLVNNLIRKQAWLYLIDSPNYCKLKLNTDNYSAQQFVCDGTYYNAKQKEIEAHRYYAQVRMDVERTLKRFPPNYGHNERLELQEILIDVIVKFLLKHDELNYYQGYHDICLTFLLVLGRENCLPLIDTITDTHLTGGVGVMFALSWFITWFSHVLDELETILRLYDLFIVSHKLMPIYVAAEIVNLNSDRVLETECDMACLHQLLSRLPSELKEDEFELVIKRALTLFDRIQPDTLELLNDDWKTTCDENKSGRILRYRSATMPDERPQNYPRFVLWGVTLTISAAAVYIWNQTQRGADPTQLLNFGDLFSALYGTR
ncbi:unnamed protein product, partial [Didymodactylos carnosus]